MTLKDYFIEYKLNNENIEDFEKFRKFLLEYNKITNITRIVDEDEFNVKHYLDSLSIFKTGLIRDNMKILDLGTGGGFPGVPLKLYKKDLDISLVDSLNKRIVFLNKAIEELNLKNIKAIHARAEELSFDKDYREKFQLVTSRAVARLRTLLEYTLPFVEVGGYFIAMKGPEYNEEIKEVSNTFNILGGKLIEVMEIDLPLDIKHYLLITKKIKPTPMKYPRQGGKPKSKPL